MARVVPGTAWHHKHITTWPVLNHRSPRQTIAYTQVATFQGLQVRHSYPIQYFPKGSCTWHLLVHLYM
jgi:hypothetical protein